MSATSNPLPGFADLAFQQLRGWPALTGCRAGDGTGRGLALRTRQIVHFHARDEAEVYLTWPVVQRMGDALIDDSNVTVQPGGDWARVRLDSPTDVTLLVSLVSVAIKANTSALGVPHREISPCPHAELAPR